MLCGWLFQRRCLDVSGGAITHVALCHSLENALSVCAQSGGGSTRRECTPQIRRFLRPSAASPKSLAKRLHFVVAGSELLGVIEGAFS